MSDHTGIASVGKPVYFLLFCLYSNKQGHNQSTTNGNSSSSSNNSSSSSSSIGGGSRSINFNNSSNNSGSSGSGCSSSSCSSGSNNNNNNGNNNNRTTQSTFHSRVAATFGSSVAVQKLRESKWFRADEQKIFCAVVECGFIVEVRRGRDSDASDYMQRTTAMTTTPMATAVASLFDDSVELAVNHDENQTPANSWFGVVLCKASKDNKPKPETIEIYSVKIKEAAGPFKMVRMSLEDIWAHGYELRINNFGDKENHAHCEKDIRNQVGFARKTKQSLWHNNKHFAYWCRYGSRQQDIRKRHMSECAKWGTVGMNAGMLLVMNKQKSFSLTK